MKLQDFLSLKNVKPYLWAREHGLNQAMIYDFLRGRRKLMLDTAILISRATQGAVSLEELNGDNN